MRKQNKEIATLMSAVVVLTLVALSFVGGGKVLSNQPNGMTTDDDHDRSLLTRAKTL